MVNCFASPLLARLCWLSVAIALMLFGPALLDECVAKPFVVHQSSGPVEVTITSHGSTASVTVDENTTTIAQITYTPLDGVLSVTGPDAALLQVNYVLDGARLAFTASPDYETPGDVGTNNVYNATVTLTYGAQTDACDFTVTVADVDEGTPGGDVTAPTVTGASVNTAGTTTTIGFSENVTGSSGLNLTASGGPVAMVYASGSGTDEYTYTNTRPILDGETVTLASASSNIVDGATNTLADFTGFSVTNNSTVEAGSGESLRPAVFPSIPSDPATAGFAQNDLSTSVRTDVVPTTRSAVIEIAAGTYTSPYTASTANRTYRLMGNVTYDGGGIILNASNITIDLNGYTLTYMNADLEEEQVGTVSSISGGDGTTRPSMVVTGVSNSGIVIEFLDGAEAGNWYEVYSGTAPNLTLENSTVSTDNTPTIRSWQDGGPSPGDTFRIFDPRKTAGVSIRPLNYNKSGIEIVNGYIVQGAAAADGRGHNGLYNLGCGPIYIGQSVSQFMVGGVTSTWSSGNTAGITARTSGGVVVKYCEVDDQGTFVSNRQRGCPAVVVGNGSTVQYSRLINHRHLGVECSGDNSTVERNEIYGDSRGTNAYGVGTYAGEGHSWQYNNIYKVGEHPICIALHSDGCQDNDVHDNWCEAKTTRPSSEYPFNYAVALSNRWGVRTLPNNIYDNSLITYSEDGPGGAAEISRGRTMFFGVLSNSAGEVVENNFIGAYNTDDETECHAIGLSLHNNKVVFRGNTIAASHNHFWTGDDYGNGSSGGRLIDNTLIKVGSDAGFKTFMTNGYVTTNVDFISNTYGTGTGTAASDIGGDASGLGSPDSGNIFRFGFNLTVTVTEAAVPVEGATVTVKDVSGNTLRSGYLTNASGVVVVDVPTFYRQGAAFGSTSLNALTVEASFGAAAGSNTISPSADDSISVGISE